MANLDTRSKRASSVQILIPFLLAPVLPDGTLSQADRQHTVHTYSGILAGTGVGPVDQDGYFLMKDSTVDYGSRWVSLSDVVFYDAEEPPETPSSTTGSDGQQTFTLPASPSPATSLLLTVEGVVRYAGIHYTLSGATITFIDPNRPFTGDRIFCWFRVL